MHKRLTIKNPRYEVVLFTRRIIAIAAGIGLLTVLWLGRLIYLQITQHQLYVTLSRQNQLNLLPIDPNRGLIYDRNGVLLAENLPVFNLEVIPDRIPHLKNTIAAVASIIPISNDELEKFYKQLKQHRRFEPVPLRTRLTEEEVARFSIDQYRFPGVMINAHLIRHYPLGSTVVAALGYVGRINEKELARMNSGNYSATNYIGKLGVEKFFETQLHGKVGYQQVEMDAAGRIVRVLKSIPPVPGDNLHLTLDSRLQKFAEDSFENENGALVAINPTNGELLALVSRPTYDPNLFVDGISQKSFHALRDDPEQPLYNRAVRGQYSPASTVKPFIALEALDSGVITPKETLFDPGWYQLKNSSRLYHDMKRDGHGVVNLNSAIIYSCDTYFYDLAHRLGILSIDTAMEHFGFGKPTGIEIQEEHLGVVPSPTWKIKTQGLSWYPGDTLITGIGHGFMLATPLQLASAVATLANRGVHHRITLLLNSPFVNGSPTLQPDNTPPLSLKNSSWDTIIHAMQGVITQGTGALRFGANAPYTAAGKTGTAQLFGLKKDERYHEEKIQKKLRDNSVFIVFAPVEKPQIALAVIAEHSKQAAAIARKVIDYYLLRLQKVRT